MGQEEGVSYLSTFDLLAEWIQHLAALDPRAYANKDARETLDSPPELHDEVASFFMMHPCLQDEMALVIQGIPADVVNEIQEWTHYQSFMHMVEFLARLTRMLRVSTIIKYAVTAKMKDGFESLNDNAAETGIQILPKVRSINDSLEPAANSAEAKAGDGVEKHWATDRLAGINSELSGIYYIEADKLTVNRISFSVKHHIVEDSFFLENKKDFLIGVSPVSQGNFLEVDYETRSDPNAERNYFKVTGLKDEELVKDRITAAILEACSRGVDILVFPEMLGNAETTSSTFIEAVADLALEKGLPMPPLLLLPTWWHDYSNELYVVDGSGRCVCVQQKQYPFSLPHKETGKKHQEDLRFDRHIVHVVHIPGLGRLTFPICRDYLEPEYLPWLAETLRSTFFFCPSYSEHKTQFDLTAPGEVKYGCYTVWSNTCAANWDKEKSPSHVGLVSGPMAKGEYIKHLEPECGGICGAQTDPCLFVVRISMDHLARISYEHIHS